jgi:hypothetical protein
MKYLTCLVLHLTTDIQAPLLSSFVSNKKDHECQGLKIYIEVIDLLGPNTS